MVDEDNFLRRWSRRKHESARQQPTAEPPPAPADERQTPAAPATSAPGASSSPSEPAPQELPQIDSLKGLASDYNEFLDPAVDENLRRSALKKLFHDPHFNVMDGLDVYIDDYSKPDPVPESMLKDLLAKHLVFPDPAEQTAKAEADERLAEGPRPDAGLPAPEAAGPSEPAPAVEAAPRAPGATEESKR